MKVTTDGCLFGAWAARYLQNDTAVKSILDVGTGTGLLALMIAQQCAAQIDAIEIAEDAYEQAKYNVEQSPWYDQIDILHSSLQNFNPQKKYDLVISNPSFFGDNPKGKTASRNQAIHADSLSAWDMLSHSIRLMKPNGQLLVMYPAHEMSKFKDLSADQFQTSAWVTVRNRDTDRVFRVIAAFTPNIARTEHSELAIRDEKGNYTQAFEDLLADYYL